MTAAQAIRSATSSAADLIGRSKDLGTVQAGKFADLIAVEGDPLKNIRTLEDVGFVMKGGVVIKTWSARAGSQQPAVQRLTESPTR